MNDDRIKAKTKEAGGKIKSTIGDIAGHDAMSAEGRLKTLEGRLQDLSGRVQDAAGEAAEDVAAFAGAAYRQGERYARQGTSVITREVVENPLKSLLIAGALGYFLSALASRRK